jgi:peptidoglycan/xylan/chitin deacetylase (PgdA/CDA1 family)
MSQEEHADSRWASILKVDSRSSQHTRKLACFSLPCKIFGGRGRQHYALESMRKKNLGKCAPFLKKTISYLPALFSESCFTTLMDGHSMSVMFTCSFDDGHPLDMKMAGLLDRHGLNGTFYVPIKNREGYRVMSPSQIKEIANRFEVGSHTLDHCYLDAVETWEVYKQIESGKAQLEDILGKKVEGFCYPGGRYHQREAKLVRACGFKYARTVSNLSFAAGAKPFELPTTIQFYPHSRAVLMRNFAKSRYWWQQHTALGIVLINGDWISRLYALFDYACVHGEVFHMWGHSREIEELEAWNEMDRFLAHVAEKVAPCDRLSNRQVADRCFEHC